MPDSMIQDHGSGVTLKIRVQPKASRSEIVGVVEGILRVRLTAPPVEGAANKECIRFLSKKLGIAKSKIEIVSGERSREKILRIDGVSRDDVRRRLLGE